MGCEHRAIARNLTASAVLSAFLCSGLTGFAAAQSPPGVQSPPGAQAKPAPAKAVGPADAKKNPEAALKAYGAGTRAFESGKMADAVTQLSTALTAGGLPGNQMAKALYYRGAAYRKQGKPAMAISDLTSALWLKGGLSDSDRALATDARQAAYREAGLGDNAPAIQAQQSAAAAPTAAAPAAPAATPAPAAAAWQTATSSGATSEPVAALTTPAAAPAPKPARVAAVQPPEDGSLSSVVASPVAVSEAAPVPVTVSAVQEAPAAPAPNAVQLNAVPGQDAAPAPANPLAGAGQAVTGFFNNMGSSIGNMFRGGSGSGSQATQTSSSSVTTSSTGVAANDAPPPTATSSWSEPVVVAPGNSKPAAKPAAAAAAPAAKTQVASAANIRLQVAAVRSREEAERVSAKLKSTPAVQSSAAATEIDETVIGNMGTFYRVRLGPFASAAEPNKLCAALKPQGYDCLVVSQ